MGVKRRFQGVTELSGLEREWLSESSMHVLEFRRLRERGFRVLELSEGVFLVHGCQVVRGEDGDSVAMRDRGLSREERRLVRIVRREGVEFSRRGLGMACRGLDVDVDRVWDELSGEMDR